MITVKVGDLCDSSCDVICHQVNCQGVMGSGIAKEIRERFPTVYEKFRKSFLEGKNKLGNIDVVHVLGGHMTVVNMYSQNDYLPRGIRHTDYTAFKECINKIKQHFADSRTKISVGFPYKIGCGLGGGDWNMILYIIENELKDWNIEIWKLK